MRDVFPLLCLYFKASHPRVGGSIPPLATINFWKSSKQGVKIMSTFKKLALLMIGFASIIPALSAAYICALRPK
jgi:hypothetical protein